MKTTRVNPHADEVHEVAQALGLAHEDATRFAALLGLLERRAAATRQAKGRLLAKALAGSAAAVLALLWARPVLAQACAQTLPSGLTTMCPDAPALASEVNGNFQIVNDWLVRKLGSFAGGNIATGSIGATGNVSAGGSVSGASGAFTGTVSAARASLSAGTIQRGGAAVTATSDLGLYSRVTGNFLRFVTNGGAMKFYTDEGADGIGTNAAFSVESDATLTARHGGESDGTLLLPSSFCVVVPLQQTCPANWDQRQVKWDTEDSSNADSGKDGRIAVDNGNTGSVLMRFCCRGAGW
jgi:hypothetical protein